MKLLLLKIKLSFSAIARLFLNPGYLLLAGVSGAVALGVVLWAFNLNLLAHILTQTMLPLLQKLGFLVSIYGSIYTNFESPIAATLVIFSLLFGINLAALVYVLRQRGKIASAAGRSAGGLGVAIVGAGCAACGTSIITPLLTGLGATSTIALASTIGLAINLASIFLMIFSIYSLGKLITNLHVQTSQRSQL